ncbi:hypothetical protein N7523_007363 [Penicillium sp. IBT 18751x]|nr:hypothetical protein N7523_007363 [Penicillium sp. IBT 18751x]
MPRRTHKKSKNGCAECKRRHIKCDESRPICSNCISSERPCFYIEGPIKNHTPKKTQKSSIASRANPGSPHGDSADSLEDVSPVNMMHVELLHHFASEMKSLFEADFNHAQVSSLDILGHCLSAPYLMNEVLALSSLHMSIIRPDLQQIYRHRAFHMQQHALAIFNAIKPELNKDSCLALFLFSSLLGVHMLCDTLVFRSGSFNTFLDNFTQYIRLHQGVRAVTDGCWEFLRQTELAPLLNVADSFPGASTSISNEYQRLLKLVESAELGESITKTYHHAIMSLQRVTAAAMSHSASRGNSHAIIAWPVIVGADYIDLLSSRQPEGLVILAHYAVLLHTRRDYWIVGDGGRYLIESISQLLGPAWETWLSWPNQSLQQDPL